MTMDKWIHFWLDHNQQIIEWLIIAILCFVLAYVIVTFFLKDKSQGDSSSSAEGGSAGLNDKQFSELEDLLQKLLLQTERVEQRTQISGGENLDGSTALPTEGEAAPSKETLKKLGELQEAIKGKEAEILKLKLDLQKSMAAKSQTPSAGGDSGEMEKLKAQLQELQARLAEYEIIEEDIADLSKYKKENKDLKKEIEALKSGGAQASQSSEDSGESVEELSVEVSSDTVDELSEGGESSGPEESSVEEVELNQSEEVPPVEEEKETEQDSAVQGLEESGEPEELEDKVEEENIEPSDGEGSQDSSNDIDPITEDLIQEFEDAVNAHKATQGEGDELEEEVEDWQAGPQTQVEPKSEAKDSDSTQSITEEESTEIVSEPAVDTIAEVTSENDVMANLTNEIEALANSLNEEIEEESQSDEDIANIEQESVSSGLLIGDNIESSKSVSDQVGQEGEELQNSNDEVEIDNDNVSDDIFSEFGDDGSIDTDRMLDEVASLSEESSGSALDDELDLSKMAEEADNIQKD